MDGMNREKISMDKLRNKAKAGMVLTYLGLVVLALDLIFIINILWNRKLADMIIYCVFFFCGALCLYYGDNLIRSARKSINRKRRERQIRSNKYVA